MLTEAYEHADKDFAERFVIEARTEADGLVRATQKAVKTGKHLVEDAHLEQILAAVKDLEQSISATDHKIIKEKIEHLNNVTRPLAEKLMNEAVGNALKDKKI